MRSGSQLNQPILRDSGANDGYRREKRYKKMADWEGFRPLSDTSIRSEEQASDAAETTVLQVVFKSNKNSTTRFTSHQFGCSL